MDDYSGDKETNERRPVSRKSSGIVLRDRLNSRGHNVPICSRINRSPMKGTQTVSSDKKEKSACPSSIRPSSNGKEIMETSSRTCFFSTRKNDKRLSLSQIQTDWSDSSSDHDDPEISDLDLHLGSENLSYREFKPAKAESSGFALSTRYFQQRFGSSSSQVARATTMNSSGPRNPRCNTKLSDAAPFGFSSGSRLHRSKDTVKKRTFNRESSSSSSDKGKNMIKPGAEERNHNSNHRVSISDPRQARDSPLYRHNGVSSVRTQKPINGRSRTRPTNQETNPNSPVPLELSSLSSEFRISGSSRIQDSFHHYNPDGIAEMLSALDRIEHDAELAYAQLLVLETGLFLGGLNLFDQHRDMRLDIDNMSYEELLALEERMGTVSTALTEEALSKCLKTSFYQTTPSEHPTMHSCGDEYDGKCCICQEDYRAGDEVGKLQCEHMYHVECIQQWLRLKNWCPICKTAV